MVQVSKQKRGMKLRAGRGASRQALSLTQKAIRFCGLLVVVYIGHLSISHMLAPNTVNTNVREPHKLLTVPKPGSGMRVRTRTATHPQEEIRAEQSNDKEIYLQRGRVTQESGLFHFDRQRAEVMLEKMGAETIRKRFTAFAEPAMDDKIPNTGKVGDPKINKDPGMPPEYKIPLPLRLNTPDSLVKLEYPRLQTCHQMPGLLPTDEGLLLDDEGKSTARNVYNKFVVADNDPILQGKTCPVNADPFLPWLHDVFPSVDGKSIIFIAQNKRRCNTGRIFENDIKWFEPQVTIMQPVSVQRITEGEAQKLAPELWLPESTSGPDEPNIRYRLAPFEESDDDAQYTRFICRFHATDFSKEDPQTIPLGETLSEFGYNPEFLVFRQGTGTMLTPKGKDNQQFWLSNFRFSCPMPADEALQKVVASGESILSDGTATIHVDLIPIRTSVRWGTNQTYFTEDLAGPKGFWAKRNPRDIWMRGDDMVAGFDPVDRWGPKNVLPRIEASGRLTNIPICLPPRPTEEDIYDRKTIESAHVNVDEKPGGENTLHKKPHVLAACIWASSIFSTRSDARKVLDNNLRLQEWIEFHLHAGFDHIYIYDNSLANTNETSLEEITSKFSEKYVTRINWPSRQCNNNIPAAENTGERSSQYAAESSCRARFGPFTEWIAAFDVDEYMVPAGQYTNLKDVVHDVGKKGTNILSMKSTRAFLSGKYTEPYWDGKGCGTEKEPLCLDKSPGVPYLESYNCEREPLPKPSWAMRGKKQLYRPDYVQNHFVHYTTVTNKMLMTYGEAKKANKDWKRITQEYSPSEVVSNEQTQVFMLHSKSTVPVDTKNWKNMCRHDFKLKNGEVCRVGNPWPNGTVVDGAYDENGYLYNCFPYDKLTDYWIPKLKEGPRREWLKSTAV